MNSVMTMNGIKGDKQRWDAANFAFILLFVVLLFIGGEVLAISVEQGAAFSDHTRTEAMSNQWVGQPINYEKMPANIDLAITLDQHLYPALQPLIKQYALKHELRIAVEEGTCGISAGALLDKKVDVAGFCCPAGETDRLPGLRYHTLGIAALALIVHPDNPLTNITRDQAQDIYRGKIGNWGELVPDFKKTISTIARLHCKNRPGHWRLILDNEDMFSPAVREVSTINDMVSITSAQNSSFGYETLWMANLYSNGGGVKALSINGAKPDNDEALIAANYPFYRTYNISTWSDPNLRKAHAEQIVAYIYEHFGEIDPKYGLIASSRLRDAGWIFVGDELISPPSKTNK